jgi:hypothetical protein
VDGVARRQEGEDVLEELVRQRGDEVSVAPHALQMEMGATGLELEPWRGGGREAATYSGAGEETDPKSWER